MFNEIKESVDIPANAKHRVFKWDKGDVYFSMARRGDALSIHIMAKTREAKRKAGKALKQFTNWCFDNFGWCKHVLGVIDPNKPGLVKMAKNQGYQVYGNMSKDDEIKAVIVGRSR